jgi:hypothetical protein
LAGALRCVVRRKLKVNIRYSADFLISFLIPSAPPFIFKVSEGIYEVIYSTINHNKSLGETRLRSRILTKTPPPQQCRVVLL